MGEEKTGRHGVLAELDHTVLHKLSPSSLEANISLHYDRIPSVPEKHSVIIAP